MRPRPGRRLAPLQTAGRARRKTGCAARRVAGGVSGRWLVVSRGSGRVRGGERPRASCKCGSSGLRPPHVELVLGSPPPLLSSRQVDGGEHEHGVLPAVDVGAPPLGAHLRQGVCSLSPIPRALPPHAAAARLDNPADDHIAHLAVIPRPQRSDRHELVDPLHHTRDRRDEGAVVAHQRAVPSEAAGLRIDRLARSDHRLEGPVRQRRHGRGRHAADVLASAGRVERRVHDGSRRVYRMERGWGGAWLRARRSAPLRLKRRLPQPLLVARWEKIYGNGLSTSTQDVPQLVSCRGLAFTKKQARESAISTLLACHSGTAGSWTVPFGYVRELGS